MQGQPLDVVCQNCACVTTVQPGRAVFCPWCYEFLTNPPAPAGGGGPLTQVEGRAVPTMHYATMPDGSKVATYLYYYVFTPRGIKDI